MNYIYLGIILSLLATLIIYVSFSRKLVKKLIDSNQAFQVAGREIYQKYTSLEEQYRILTQVNKFLKRPTISKK